MYLGMSSTSEKIKNENIELLEISIIEMLWQAFTHVPIFSLVL